MDQEPAVIRQQIDETRSSLKDKLETLHNQVRDKVQEAKATVENVQARVQDTVQSVKQTFDLKYQVEHHPWFMLGGSLLAGFLLGTWGSGRRGSRADSRDFNRAENLTGAQANGSGFAGTPSSLPGFLDQVLEKFGPELEQLKGLAAEAIVNILHEVVQQLLEPKPSAQAAEGTKQPSSVAGAQPVMDIPRRVP